MQISPVRQIFSQLDNPIFFPYGKTSSRNALAHYSSRPEQKCIEVLFLNCGDLQKALHTASSQLGNQIFQLHINESCIKNISRNILILKIISSPNFAEDPTDTEDMDYLWSVWYEVCWTESVITRFKKDIEQFFKEELPENIKLLDVKGSNNSFDSIKKVWKDWVNDAHSFFKDSYKATEILIERQKAIYYGWKTQYAKEVLGKDEVGHIEVKVLTCYIMKHMGVDNFPTELRNCIANEINNFFSLSDQRNSKVLYLNPTLLQFKTLRWFVPHTVCPFNGFLPLPVNELKPNENDPVASNYCRKVLMQQVTTYQLKGEKIKWTFSWKNSLELCYTIAQKFDVVLCSELADQVGLANILNATSMRLNEEPESMILIETSNWSSLAPTPYLYVEEALCAPLSMLPSIYGVRLSESILFGVPTLPYPTTLICLTWRRTQPYKNLRPELKPFINQNLMQLARKCFFLKNQQQDELCGMKCYTPMTFLNVLRSAAERLGRGNDALVKSALVREIGIDPHFKLFCRTLRKWAWPPKSRPNHRVRLLKISVKIAESGIESFLSITPNSTSSSKLRLALIPNDVYDILTTTEPFDVFSCEDAHCIDNFLLEACFQNGSGLPWVRVCFPLVSDHGLTDTHSGIVVDVQNGLPVMRLNRLSNFKSDPIDWPYPFADSGPYSLPEEMKNLSCTDTPCLTVHGCVETEQQYTFHVKCFSVDLIKDLLWLTDHQLPCESAHRIGLVVKQRLDIQPLKVSVPHPFDVETVTMVPGENDEVQLILKKSLLEPWPSEFTSPTESDLDCLLPFQSDDYELFKLLNIQLEQQFDSKKSLKDMTSLDTVRILIAGLFELTMKKKHSFITIRCLNKEDRLDDVERIQNTEPNWYLVIHPTIFSNRNGTPVLIISAFDRSVALKRIAKGELSEEEVEADVKRIFFDKATGIIPSLVSSSPDSSELFRYILRLGSLRFSPTKWQRENLPLGKNSPWLPTFLSPCYSYQRSSLADILSLHDTYLKIPLANESKRSEKTWCAYCIQKTRKNQCACCKAVYYCDVLCQKKHLRKHKMVCTKSIPNHERP